MNSYYEKIVATGEVKCIDEEIPFDIPQGWEWTRLSRIVYNHGQKAPDEVFSYIDIGSIDNVNQKLNSKETILNANEAPSRARRIIRFGDIIYSTVRPYLHNTCIIDRTFLKPAIASTGFAVFACHRGLINKYLFNYLLTPQFDAYANDKNNAKGVAYPAINDEKLYKALVPVPPTNEQNRIINIIEQLSPYVSRYSEAASALKSLNTQLGESLKRSILQQAIQGKLVSQTAADGTAQELLEQIKKEKQKLVKEGKLKKADSATSIIFKGDDNKYWEKSEDGAVCIDEEIPFEIPSNWAWVRLDDICSFIHRGKSPQYSPIKKYPVVAQKCNQWDGFSIEKAKFIDPQSISLYDDEYFLQDRDLMWNSTGLGTLGRIAIYYTILNPYELAVADSHVTVIRPYKTHIVSEYLYYYFASNTVQFVIEDKSDGSTKQKELATKTVKAYIVPIPPFAEQQRIVQKIKSVTSIVSRWVKNAWI